MAGVTLYDYFKVCILTCTLSLICPDCGKVMVLDMEDYL